MRYAQKRCLQIYSIDKAHIYSHRKLENKNYTKKQKEKEREPNLGVAYLILQL